MRIYTKILVFLSLLTPCAHASKQNDKKPTTISQCLEMDDTAKIFNCFDEVDHLEELQINAVYNKLIDVIKARGEDDRVELLRNAERAWIRFRDNQCKYNVSSEEGPGEAAGAANAICVIQQTQDRRRVLQGMLQDELGRN
ncbi:MAG: DUF1311 domain-containing protein [Bdellovibrionales bacterium]|nr:DUF1311 domain-containing protein [Bdellovibrionales bacterium]